MNRHLMSWKIYAGYIIPNGTIYVSISSVGRFFHVTISWRALCRSEENLSFLVAEREEEKTARSASRSHASRWCEVNEFEWMHGWLNW